MNNSAPLRSTILRSAALLLLGSVLLFPFINLQGFLSTGDHGRELYAFAHIFDGKDSQTPYQDYWWMYGPFMIYYYGLCMKIFGTSVLSVLIGKTLLLLLTGTFIGLAVMSSGSTIAGLAAAAWFWVTFLSFFHTHNHTGGLVCIALLGFGLLSYIQKGTKPYLWLILCSLTLLALIKLNMAIVVLATSALSVFIVGLTDSKPLAAGRGSFFLGALVTVPLLVVGIHALYLHGLFSYEINQCFPFGTHDRQHSTTPWHSLLIMAQAFFKTLSASRAHQIMALIFWISTIRLIWLTACRQLDPFRLRNTLLSVATLTLFYIALLHEYLFSGVAYCIYWAQPIWIITMFILISWAAEKLRLFWKILIWITVTAVLVYLLGFKYIGSALDRSPERHFRHPRVNAYVQNEYTWLLTINMTTSLLERNLRPGENFFAFPYDPLYYYLLDRKTPTWQTCFFNYQHVPPEQEKQTITDLENNKINWVVLSNRIASSEAGLGLLGRDYCPLLAKYIEQHFTPVFMIGDWRNPAGWAWNYGTMILRRRTP